MEAIEVRNDYREAATLVTGDDRMKQEQVTTEMEPFEDDLQKLLKVINCFIIILSLLLILCIYSRG